MMAERIKTLDRLGQPANRYFWPIYDRQEIELIEEWGGKLRAYEFALIETKRPPAIRLKTYPNSTVLL